MIRDQPRELAPMTAARSAASHVRPCSRANVLTDLVPPDLGVDEDPIEVEDDRAVQVRPPTVAATAAVAWAAASSRRSGPWPASGRSTTAAVAGSAHPAVDGGEEVEGEAGDGVGDRHRSP